MPLSTTVTLYRFPSDCTEISTLPPVILYFTAFSTRLENVRGSITLLATVRKPQGWRDTVKSVSGKKTVSGQENRSVRCKQYASVYRGGSSQNRVWYYSVWTPGAAESVYGLPALRNQRALQDSCWPHVQTLYPLFIIAVGRQYQHLLLKVILPYFLSKVSPSMPGRFKSSRIRPYWFTNASSQPSFPSDAASVK